MNHRMSIVLLSIVIVLIIILFVGFIAYYCRRTTTKGTENYNPPWKIPIHIITTTVDKKETIYQLHEEMNYLKHCPFIDITMHRFNSPCHSYGTSDKSRCARKNIYENHQHCARALINFPYGGLVFENDIEFMGRKKLWKNLTKIMRWVEKNINNFDMLFLGCLPVSVKDTKKFIIICDEVYHVHAVWYSPRFCKTLLSTHFNEFNDHFDAYFADGHKKPDIKKYMLRNPIALQRDKKHREEEISQYKKLCLVRKIRG